MHFCPAGRSLGNENARKEGIDLLSLVQVSVSYISDVEDSRNAEMGQAPKTERSTLEESTHHQGAFSSCSKSTAWNDHASGQWEYLCGRVAKGKESKKWSPSVTGQSFNSPFQEIGEHAVEEDDICSLFPRGIQPPRGYQTTGQSPPRIK